MMLRLVWTAIPWGGANMTNVAGFRAPREDAEANPAVRPARIDLAAAHRLADRQGFSEGIFNHFTLAVPGADDRYLQIPFGLSIWSEGHGQLLYGGRLRREIVERPGDIERSGVLYPCSNPSAGSPVLLACCTPNMPYASALTRLADPRIEAIGQTEIGFLDCVA